MKGLGRRRMEAKAEMEWDDTPNEFYRVPSVSTFSPLLLCSLHWNGGLEPCCLSLSFEQEAQNVA